MKSVSLGNEHFNSVDLGQGPPLLFVHGFPLNHTMWNSQIDSFSPNHRVIAPDLRGFGGSVASEGTVTMEQYADDLARLLDALSVAEPVVFCGLSMGGYIAWQFWRRHADRLAALVLCDTRAIADTEVARQGRIAMALRVATDGTQFVADAMLPKLVAAKTHDKHPQIVQAIHEMILSTPPNGIAAAQRGMAERPDVTPWLSDIEVPSLVVVGVHDEISRCDEMRSIADAIPNCAFNEIPDAGHMAPMENPEAVNRAIAEFLDANGS